MTGGALGAGGGVSLSLLPGASLLMLALTVDEDVLEGVDSGAGIKAFGFMMFAQAILSCWLVSASCGPLCISMYQPWPGIPCCTLGMVVMEVPFPEASAFTGFKPYITSPWVELAQPPPDPL